MKAKIHPKFMKTKVTCSSCATTFETYSTVPEMNVEICSNCHPFYTGKQKLVDTAGRVDRFRAQSAAAKNLRTKTENQPPKKIQTKVDKSNFDNLSKNTTDLKQNKASAKDK